MPEFDMTDRVFGPPCTMGTSMGYANMSCRVCAVGWASADAGKHCWICGLLGEMKSVAFAGSNVRFIDEPPLAYRRKAA